MAQVTCIQKFRDKQNKIYGYRIQDPQGNIKDVKSEALKRAMADKQIDIINLKLTSDNRLIDTDVKIIKKSITQDRTLEEKVQAALVKAPFIGVSVPEVLYELACQAGFQDIIELSETNCVGIKVGLNTHFKNYKDALEHPEATIYVTNMSDMFDGYRHRHLELSKFNTSNVIDMREMFSDCKAKTLDLSSFNTSNVTDMYGMFWACKAKNIDLSSFNTSNVKDMSIMFRQCEAKTLNLSSFDTSNVTNMCDMFYKCEAKTLDLSNFNTSNVTNMSDMFVYCLAQTLDLSSFNTSNVTEMYDMFYGCKAKIKATDPRILHEYNNR